VEDDAAGVLPGQYRRSIVVPEERRRVEQRHRGDSVVRECSLKAQGPARAQPDECEPACLAMLDQPVQDLENRGDAVGIVEHPVVGYGGTFLLPWTVAVSHAEVVEPQPGQPRLRPLTPPRCGEPV